MMRFTTRLILTAALLAVSATAATAGPILDGIRERRAERRTGCNTCQTQPSAPVQYTQPAPVVMPQLGTVGPVRQVVGTVLVTTGGLVQATGGLVQGDGYTPIRLASPVPVYGGCPGGVCR